MLALASLLSISPLGFSTAPTPEPTPEPTPACKTIAEILAETEYLSTLNTVVNAMPDVLALLLDPALNLTVFAPNDTALLPFASVLNDTLADGGSVISARAHVKAPEPKHGRQLGHCESQGFCGYCPQCPTCDGSSWCDTCCDGDEDPAVDLAELLSGHVMYGISMAEALLAASRYGEDKEVEVTPVNGETIYLFETEPNSLSLGPVLCVDTNGNEKDSAGDGCSWYTSHAQYGACGTAFNTATFFSYEMCCACGGGLAPPDRGAATVVVPNIKACNGIVHVIDKVLGGDDEDGDDPWDDDPWDFVECSSHEECGDWLIRANVTDDALPVYCAVAPWGCQHCDGCFHFDDSFDGTCPSVCHQYANTTDDGPDGSDLISVNPNPDFVGRRRLRAKKEGKFPTLKKEGKSGIKRRLQVGKKEGKFPTLKKEGKSGIKRRLQVGKKGGKAATSSTDIKHGI